MLKLDGKQELTSIDEGVNLPLINNVHLTKVHTPQLSDTQYLKAIENSATHVRIGSNIFGSRN